jgi:hypothetical protein
MGGGIYSIFLLGFILTEERESPIITSVAPVAQVDRATDS